MIAFKFGILGEIKMMQLGGYQFAISTAAFDSLSRTSNYRWASHEVYGRRPVSQFTGVGDEVIQLEGVILPEYRGGFGQVDKMRKEAGKGQPLTMVSGTGKIMGRWCIEQISERQGVFAVFGLARRQEFSLQLRRFD